MNNKVIKTVDEHNIDRDASVMFAFDLEGSEYVSYRISRDEEQDNLFVSKIIKDTDGTFKMLNVDDVNEKATLNSVVMALVEGAVKNPSDKLNGNSVTLSDGKTVKFIDVNFNKEQNIEVKKTYVTTVKKEVSRVAEKYYDVEVVLEQPKTEDVFPSITPVVPVVEEVRVVEPITEPTNVVAPAVQPTSVEQTTVLTSPVVESPVIQPTVVVQPQPTVIPTAVAEPIPSVVEPITMPNVEAATNIIVQPVQVEQPIVNASSVEPTSVTPVAVTPVVVEPVPVSASVVSEPQPLVFNASKETNLNAALGEVANTATIPVENIQPIREFGVDTPVQQPIVQQQVIQQPAVVPMVQPELTSAPKTLTKKAGFANSKFFMVVAIAFFLASCVFLGYEVFNYFQLTK